MGWRRTRQPGHGGVDGSEQQITVEMQQFIGRRAHRICSQHLTGRRIIRVRNGDGEIIIRINRIQLFSRQNV